MGMRVCILELTGCTATPEKFPCDVVHAVGDCGGDQSTLCGLPFVDEVKRYAETVNPVSCVQCQTILNHAAKYKNKNGEWK